MIWIILLIHFGSVKGFGQVGHNIIGEQVQKYLSNSSLDHIAHCEYLKAFDNDLGKASSRADVLSHRHGFQWTAGYHYLDIPDDPPMTCAFGLPKEKDVGATSK